MGKKEKTLETLSVSRVLVDRCQVNSNLGNIPLL